MSEALELIKRLRQASTLDSSHWDRLEKAVHGDLNIKKLQDEATQSTRGVETIKTLAGRPLIIGVDGDELVIRIGVDTLVFAFEIGEENNPFDHEANDFRRSFKVSDKHEFAKGVANGLCNEEEDGSTPLTKILDEAYIHAVEGAYGVDEDARIVTQEMLEYHGE